MSYSCGCSESPLLGFGQEGETHQPPSTAAYVIMGGIGLVVAGALALSFYRAYKGLPEPGVVYGFHGHHGHGHHGHPGLSVSFASNKKRRGRRTRR